MIDLIVHATHEAGVKVGGIGAVLAGLLSSASYNEAIRRTVLLGSYDAENALESERLRAARNGLTILYHTSEGIIDVPDSLAHAFHEIQQFHRVSILYGTRRFGNAQHEVLLVDGKLAHTEPINDLKAYLYAQHGFHSSRYEGEPEFDLYLGVAAAAVSALHALIGTNSDNAFFIAHEWLGLPALLAAEQHLPGQFRTVFYAHETATVRALIESHPGHDLRFYNAMRIASEMALSLEEVFGNQSAYYKHAFLQVALSLDGIFAVGDLVKEELEFLDPDLKARQIDLVYNGVPSMMLDAGQKAQSKALLQTYAQTLFGFSPTWIFSHVTRLVPSKGIWRDIRVMEHVDRVLAARGETAVFYLLSTVQPTGRRSEDVHRWEAEYGWPVHHRADNGDLLAYEWDYYQMVEAFNREAQASRILFVNQFGWSADRCGERMPAEMSFMDLRYGTDVEFGQSIYEPFGIAQVEPLSFGALSVLSSACGCLGFIRDASGLTLPNVVVGDYLYLPAWAENHLENIMDLGRSTRDKVEMQVAHEVSNQIMERLPQTEEEKQARLADGYALGSQMSWDVVITDYLLPALNRIID